MNPTTLSETLSELLAGVGAVSWRTGWLIVALVALRFVVRGRIPAQVWFAVWIVVALRLVLPFSVPLTWSPFNLTAEKSPPRVEEPVVVGPAPKMVRAEVPRVATAQPATAAMESKMATPTSGWTGREVLVAIWLAGIALLGGLRSAAAESFRRRLRSARPMADGRLIALVAREAAGWRTRVTCYETKAVEAPALCGWFRPQLLFPVGLAANLTDEELRFVVRHELGHWRRRDLWTQALMQVAVVVHWFNPFVWLAARLARTDCELACDESVLRRGRGESASAYGAALLKVLGVVGERRSPLAVVGILENRRRLAERVRMIADYRAASVGRVVGGVALVALVAVTSATRETRAEEAKVGAKTPAVRVTTSAQTETEEQARVRAETRARIDASRRAWEALSKTVLEQKAKVEQLADQLAAYKAKHSLGSLEHEKRLVDDLLRATNLEASRAQVLLQATEIRANQAKEFFARGALQELAFVAHQPNVSQAVASREDRRREDAEVRSRLGAAHPDAIKAREATIEAELAVGRAEELAVKQLDAEFEGARRKSAQIQESLKEARKRSLDLDLKALQYTKLERELKLNEQALQGIATRARETYMLSGRSVPQAMHAGPLVYLVGQVSRPGNYPLPEGVAPSPAKLVATAGGFTATGDARLVRVTRVDPTTREAKVWVLNLDWKDADLAGAGFVLEAGDIVFVPAKG